MIKASVLRLTEGKASSGICTRFTEITVVLYVDFDCLTAISKKNLVKSIELSPPHASA